jgi:release factor glutamine methyltransferase
MTASRFALDPTLSRATAQRALTDGFAAAGIETAALDARLILCHALGISHLDLLRDPEMPIGVTAANIAALANRRMRGEPISRIRGRREFHGLDFAISPAVLDPRPETEILVEAVLPAFADRRLAPLKVLDLGVGSGAILGALLSQLPDAFGVGIDRSEAACRVARVNLARLGLSTRSRIICGDWAEAVSGAFDVIVANPPYVASDDIAMLARDVREHDPRAALDGGADGLAAYRVLAPAVARVIASRGMAAFEVGMGQADSVAALLKGAGLQALSTRCDLAGHVRVVTARS